ncbi:MAG: Dot/Icm T4SS effector Wip [Gammaproteobacteria bacterium]
MAMSQAKLSNTMINEPANISNYPPLDSAHPADEANQFTIGDLHGNALKLIYFLIRQNVITLDKALYNEFVTIYTRETSKLKAKDLERFEFILSQIKENPVGLVRLIGDEFCDRGSNDYFTLKILQRLKTLNIPFEILSSNHGIEFMFQAEAKESFTSYVLVPPHDASLLNLDKLIVNGLVKREEVDKIFNECIKSSYRALSYSLGTDKNKITIYSHAGIGLTEIAAAANKLGVKFNDKTAEELAQTIDAINDQYSMYVTQNKLHELYSYEIMFKGYEGKVLIDSEKYPFDFMLWNRFYEYLSRPEKHSKGNYAIDFAHGHDSSEDTHQNIFNLDNRLGKESGYFSGRYNILYSQEIPSYRYRLMNKSDISDVKEVNQETTHEPELKEPRTPVVTSDWDEFGSLTKTGLEKYYDQLKEAKIDTDTNKAILDKARIYDVERVTRILLNLNKEGILNESTIAIFQAEYDTGNLTTVIRELKENNLLDQTTFILLAKIVGTSTYWQQSFAEEIRILQDLKNKELLTPDLFNLLIKNPEHLRPIGTGLVFLVESKLLTAENQAAVVAKPQHAHHVAVLLSYLNNYGKLNSDTLKMSIDNAQYAGDIVQLLKIFPKRCDEILNKPAAATSLRQGYASLISHRNVTEQNIKIIFDFPEYASDFANALFYLEYGKIFNEYYPLLCANPQYAYSLAQGLSSLAGKGMLTPKLEEILVKNAQYANLIADALGTLKNRDIQIDDEIINLLVKHQSKASDLSGILASLIKGKIFTKAVYAAISNMDSAIIPVLHEVCSYQLENAKLLTEANFLTLVRTLADIQKAQSSFLEKNLALLNKTFSQELVKFDDVKAYNKILEPLGIKVIEEGVCDSIIKTMKEKRALFMADEKETDIQKRLENAKFELNKEPYHLFSRLKSAGLISKARQRLSQEIFDKLMKSPEIIPELSAEVNALPLLPLATFNSLLDAKQKQLQHGSLMQSYPEGLSRSPMRFLGERSAEGEVRQELKDDKIAYSGALII